MELRWDDHGVLWVTPPAGVDDVRTMRQCRAQLRAELDASEERVRLLFDLRSCTLGLAQLHFTVRTLLKNEAYMRVRLERSVALLPGGNRAVKALADLFLRMYTPVRPFRIEVDAHAAHAFVRTTEVGVKAHRAP